MFRGAPDEPVKTTEPLQGFLIREFRITLPQGSESQRLADVTGTLDYQAKTPQLTFDTWPDVVFLAAAIGRKLCRDS